MIAIFGGEWHAYVICYLPKVVLATGTGKSSLLNAILDSMCIFMCLDVAHLLIYFRR